MNNENLLSVLCIPRVYTSISEDHIRKVFNELKLGLIHKIDIKHIDRDNKFNKVFIHINQWNKNQNATAALELLTNGKEIKIIYDNPWFWKVYAYKAYSKPVIKRP